MDIKLPKKPWYVRYRRMLAGGAVLAGLMVYALVLQLRPRTLRITVEDDQVAQVCDSDFLEYVDASGLVCPAASMRVTATEGGTVERICHQNGDLLRRGDTILVLSNPKVLDEIAAELSDYELRQTQHRQQLTEMQQKSITLRQQALAADFELRKIRRNYELEQEEGRMGVKSAAQIEVAREEYEYNRQRTLLSIESLRHDSVLAVISRQLIEQQMTAEAQKLRRSMARREALVVLAPTDGQIAGLSAVVGGQVAAGEQVGEIGVLGDYKVTARLSEYYIDRIRSGLPATAFRAGHRYTLSVSRVTPQIQDHSFAVELTGDFLSQKVEGDVNLMEESASHMEDVAVSRIDAGDSRMETADDVMKAGGSRSDKASVPSLRPGLSLRLQIELGQPERRLIIPRGNFYAQTGGQWIMRLDPSGRRARRVPIRLGRQNAEFYEVLEGLQPGDRVLVSGYDRFGTAEVVEW